MRLYALVVATHKEGYYDALVESCRRNEIPLVVLGMGQKWQGFAWRFLLVKNHLDTMKDDDIVVFLDAYDMIATQHASVVEERFLELKSPIVISVEMERSEKDWVIQYMDNKIFGYCDKATVCAGAYMGYVYALKKMYAYICKKFHCQDPQFSHLDDQQIFTSLCNDDRFVQKYIQYDHDSYIFHTTHTPTSCLDVFYKSNISEIMFQPDHHQLYYLQDNRLYLTRTRKSPCFIHAIASTNIDFLIRLYGLPSRRYKRQRALLVNKNIYRIFKVEIAIIGLFIIYIVYRISINFSKKR